MMNARVQIMIIVPLVFAASGLLPTPQAFSIKTLRHHVQPSSFRAPIATITTPLQRQRRDKYVKLSVSQKEPETQETGKADGNSNTTEDDHDVDEKEKYSIYDITRQWEAAKEEASEFWKNVILSDNQDEDDGDAKMDRNIADSKLKEEEEAIIQEAKESSEEMLRQERENNKNQPTETKEKEKDILEPLKRLLVNNDDDDEGKKKKKPKPRKTFEQTAKHFAGLLTSKGKDGAQSIRDIVDTARESAEEGEVSDQMSFQEILDLLRQYSKELKLTADKYFGSFDFSQVYPTSLFYYIEYEDERKNPSWKRRMHRFYPGINLDKMNELNNALTLARLSYYETSEDVRQRLHELTTPYELVSCDLRASEPGKLAHFLAVKKNQNSFSPALEVALGVRGTKTITDAITDLLFEATDYRGGKAHSGMLSSGKYIAEKHQALLQKLLEASGKKYIKLLLIGHSLGAGAASIAAMELNDLDFVEPRVIGFGSPAILSQDLSEQMEEYMTTVVSDDDCVPRLSAPTVVNALLDVQEFDYVPRAKRDIEQAVTELSKMYPLIVPEERKDKLLDLIDPLLQEHVAPSINKRTERRMEVELYPPGKIVHFYRDGSGISGSIVPCTFFNQLDVKRRMVLDHLFHSGYERIFLDIMRLHYKDHSFVFENPVTPVDDDEDE